MTDTKLERLDRSRLARESAKLDAMSEQKIADEDLSDAMEAPTGSGTDEDFQG